MKLGVSPRSILDSARQQENETEKLEKVEKKKTRRKRKQKSPEKAYKDIVVVTVDTEQNHEEIKVELDKYRSPPQDS